MILIGTNDIKIISTHLLPSLLLYCSFFLSFIKVQLIYNIVMIFAVQQSDSIIHIHASILFQILFSFRLSQKIGQSSLCYNSRFLLASHSICHSVHIRLCFLIATALGWNSFSKPLMLARFHQVPLTVFLLFAPLDLGVLSVSHGCWSLGVPHQALLV